MLQTESAPLLFSCLAQEKEGTSTLTPLACEKFGENLQASTPSPAVRGCT